MKARLKSVKLSNQVSRNPTNEKPSQKIKKVSKENTIKYADKSEGQPEMVIIYNELKKLLQPYSKGSIKAQDGVQGMFNLVSNKKVEVLGKIRDIFFASIMVQKGYVGFYFFPIYTDSSEISPRLKPELLKCLKGKSCFHIKKNDFQLLLQVKEALAIGHQLYKAKGWV